MKIIMAMVAVVFFGLVQVATAQYAVSDIGSNDSTMVIQPSVPAAPAEVKSVSSDTIFFSSAPVVYVINMGPKNVLEVKEDGGKKKAHDKVLPKHIGQFRYDSYARIVLAAKSFNGHKAIFFSKKVAESGSEEFAAGAWLWVFRDGQEPVKTQDLSLLRKLLGK